MIGAATRRVTSTDGTELAVHDNGRRSRPTLVAVHGYPDDHHVWDEVGAELEERFHVVAYDVRGAGESDRPSGRGAYRLPQLVDDLLTVVDDVSPHAPVHLVGHDWGSVQSWSALSDGRLAGRIASFTSISGPSVDYVAAWLLRAHQHPGAALRQLAESYYIALFQLPGLPELAVDRGLLDRAMRRYAPAEYADTAARRADQRAGLQLYRSNLLAWRPRPPRVHLPVQVIAPQGDPFVTVELQTQAPAPYVDGLRTRVVEGGHWLTQEDPALVARLVADFAEEVTT